MLSENNSLSLIFFYLNRYKLRVLAVFAALFFSASAVLAIGYILRNFVNKSFVEHNLANLGNISLILSGVILVLALASALRSAFITNISEQIGVDIRFDLYRTLIHKNISFFETCKIADVLTTLLNDVQLIQSTTVTVFSFFIRNTILFFGGLALLFYTNVVLTSYTLVIIPVVLIPAIIMIKKVKICSRETQDNLSLVSSHVEETLSGIKLVQASNAQNFEVKNFNEFALGYLYSVKKKSLYRSLLVATIFSLVGGSVLLILYIGGNYVITGKMTSGDLVSFIFYAVVVASAAGGMSEVAADLAKVSGANERVKNILSLNEKSEKKQSHVLNGFSALEFQSVSFRYSSRPNMVLNNLSFTINKGDKIAISGKSGSGKSTLINLIQKFYVPTSGRILINGVDLQDCSDSAIRKLIGVVSQETFIFSNSVLYNIAYGKSDTSLEEVISAAKIANIHDFIMSLPDKYQTHLGEKGVKLSGGQKQRIAIARIIINDPEILILDEATSNLDEANIETIQSALDKIMKGRTSIAISHRPATIKNFAKVIEL